MSDSRSQIIFICDQPSAIRYPFTVGRRLEVKVSGLTGGLSYGSL